MNHARQTLLLTGASGFVGKHLSDRLVQDGWIVRGVCRRSPHAQCQIQIQNFDSQTDWREALAGCSVVVHLAAITQVRRRPSEQEAADLHRVNVDGTIALARQAAAEGVERLIFLSSAKVSRLFVSDESACIKGADHLYETSKLNAERALARVSQETGLETVVVRCPLVYGPGVKGNFATLIRWIQRGVPLPFGAIENRRSMIAIENLVDFLSLCADRSSSPRAANEILTVSDAEDLSTTELLRRVAQAYEVPARLLPVPASILKGLATLSGQGHIAERLLESFTIEDRRAFNLLGWSPRVSMQEQLHKMVEHDQSL